LSGRELTPTEAKAIRIGQSPAVAHLASLSPGSRRTSLQSLEIIARMLDINFHPAQIAWDELEVSHASAIRSKLIEEYAVSTARRHWTAFRGVIRWCWRLEQMPSDRAQRILDLPAIKGETPPAGRSLTRVELRRLIGAAREGEVIGVRDRALVALLYGAGLRRQEAVDAMWEDLDLSSRRLKITGKGRKTAEVFLPAWAARDLRAWGNLVGLRTGVSPHPNGWRALVEHGGHLLCPIDRKGVPRWRARLSANAAWKRIKLLGERARVECTPHDLRRSMVTELLDAGAELGLVQDLARHSDPRTTRRYDRRPGQRRAAAADLLPDPRRED
jgi:integrase